MSITILAPKSTFSETAARRRFRASVFASAIQNGRLAVGLSVEDAAQLAGLSTSEWAAIEAGSVPRLPAQLRAIAGTLQIRYERLLDLVLLCRDAWEL